MVIYYGKLSGLFKDPSCPVDFCPLKSSFIHYYAYAVRSIIVQLRKLQFDRRVNILMQTSIYDYSEDIAYSAVNVQIVRDSVN